MCRSSWSLGGETVGFRLYSDQSTETSLPVQHFFVISYEFNSVHFSGCRPHSASALLSHFATKLLPSRDSSKSLLAQKHILPLAAFFKDITVSSEKKSQHQPRVRVPCLWKFVPISGSKAVHVPVFLGSVKQQKRWNPTAADWKTHKGPLSPAILVRAQHGVI